MRRLAWCLTALFLVVVGAKLWLIQGYATPIPYWDQWIEADRFFKPWTEGHLTWREWLAPHNGHRIFFTRLLDFACVKLNGEWDPLLQMTVNAVLHAGCLCGLVGCLWVFNGRKDPTLLGLLLVPFLALPVAAENTLWGFQSQFYFLLGFALAALAGLGFHRFGSPGWLLGLAAAGLSLFTMASGFIAALAVAGLLGLRWLKQGRLDRGDWITAGASLAIGAIGVMLGASAGVLGHASWGNILTTLAWTLAWPFENKPTLLLFTCLPLALTTVKYFRDDFRDARAAEFLMALGLWGVLQSAALAYVRTDQVNCSRYADLFCIVPMASLASLFILGGGKLFQRSSPGWLTALATGWAVILLWGLWNVSPRDWQNYDDAGNYPLWSAQTRLIQEENIRTFIATGKLDSLRHAPEVGLITNALTNPKLSRILPPACRPALAIEKAAGSDAAFVPDGCPPDRPPRDLARTWGSYSTKGAAATGRFISQPITATLPKLDLELCCAPNADNLSIELVEESSGRRVPVVPQITGRWQVVTVDAPKSPFHLELTDHSATAWVAVGDLRDSGRISNYAHRLIALAVFILLAGLGLFAGLAGQAVIRRSTELSPYPVIRWLTLLAALAALAVVWMGRNFDATTVATELYVNCAKTFSSSGHLAEARRYLDEALWLRPEDEELKAQLRAFSKPAAPGSTAVGKSGP